jgi:UDP-N-acetylglucosamine enolpyruvyl transferase
VRQYRVTESTGGEVTITSHWTSTQETLEAFVALVEAHATSPSKASVLIGRAEQRLPGLPVGCAISALPNDTHRIAIERLSDAR